MRNFTKSLLLGAAALALYSADFDPGAPGGVVAIASAQAIIGRPMTPVSYAGVARRSVYRGGVYHPVATAAVVTGAAVATSAAVAAASQPTTVVVQQQAPASSGAPIGTIVTSLPSGCSQLTMNDTSYYNCGGTYFRTAFQGNTLVYVVSEP